MSLVVCVCLASEIEESDSEAVQSGLGFAVVEMNHEARKGGSRKVPPKANRMRIHSWFPSFLGSCLITRMGRPLPNGTLVVMDT